jgi:outer membrane protein TolC
MTASRAHRALRCAWLGCLALLACATHQDGYRDLELELERSRPPGVPEADPSDGAGFFEGARELDRGLVVRRVLERNPNLRAAHYAWTAALERYPQASALEDPVLGYSLAPRSLDSSEVDPGQRFDLSQRLPFPGKLRLRGSAALAEAEVSAHEFAALRVQLAALASTAFDDYYVAVRAIEINADHANLLRVLSRSALARYQTGAGSQQDPLQAETELARLAQQQLDLFDELARTRAALNTLLHRSPEAFLPDPPARLELTALPAGADAIPAGDEEELGSRPDLAAARARLRARDAERGVARREFLPDLTLMGSYDRFWEESELRSIVGVEIELPLQLDRRRAELREAEARVEQARSELSARTDSALHEVLRARQALERARKLRALYDERLLPTARDRVQAARAGFETNRNSFSDLIDAEHELRDLRFGAEQALADESRRRAQLLAALGRLPLEVGEAR